MAKPHALWRVKPYLRPYVGQMVAATLLAGVGLGAATVVPLVVKAVIDGPLAEGDRRGIVYLGLATLALGVLESLAAFTRRLVAGTVSLGLETTLRNDLYAHLQRLPVSFHDNWQSGQLLSRAMSDCRVIRRFFGFGVVFFVVNVITFLVVLVLMLRLDPVLAGATALSAVPLVWMSLRFERKYLVVSRRVQDQDGDLTTRIEEGATGIRVIKAFGRRDLVRRQFVADATRLYDSSMEQVRLRAKFWALIDMVPNLTMAAILFGGALAVGRGSLTIGGLVAFISLLVLLVWPIESLGEILAMAEEATSAAERVYEVFDTAPAIVDRADAVALDACEGRVRFENVSFTYGTDTILRDIDLEIAPGETLALVGVTGSGKTTLTSLLPRLYDVSAGRVTLDGHDVRSLTLPSLRRHVAVAFEEPTLFSASVRENLLLGWPEASDDDIDVALSIAQAEFVRDLPWGLDTRVGEQGLSLSGGQRQRLALARAVIGRPQVLVLDDPLSALDVHTEALVEEALRRVLQGVTALLVVHRPSTLALADRVAFLHEGTIAAVGTHSELMERVPAYADVLSQQADVEVSADEMEEEAS
ncbi:MAG: ATP-binding cassette, subfamily bacterial [Actinomycetota bacterium]|jgi:ATP-binding cassette subfamily B protein|nr:ATP-binding cassette, subfamily bacterial [Actinomycetota bacterium]